MVSKLTHVLLEALSEKKELTLQELYDIVADNPEFVWDTAVRKHRIRSSLYNLQKTNRVERSDACTYKIV